MSTMSGGTTNPFTAWRTGAARSDRPMGAQPAQTGATNPFTLARKSGLLVAEPESPGVGETVANIGKAGVVGTLRQVASRLRGASIVAGGWGDSLSADGLAGDTTIPSTGTTQAVPFGGGSAVSEAIKSERAAWSAGFGDPSTPIPGAPEQSERVAAFRLGAHALAFGIDHIANQQGYVRSEGWRGIAEDVAGAAPDMAAGVGLAAGVGMVNPVAGLGVGAAYFGLTEGLQQADETFSRAIRQGMDQDSAERVAADSATVYAMGSGVLEFVGLGAVMKGTRLARTLGRTSEKIAKSKAGPAIALAMGTGRAAVGEGLTEVAQGVYSEAVDGWMREDWSQFAENVGNMDEQGRTFIVAAILGGGAHVGVRGMEAATKIDPAKFQRPKDYKRAVEQAAGVKAPKPIMPQEGANRPEIPDGSLRDQSAEIDAEPDLNLTDADRAALQARREEARARKEQREGEARDRVTSRRTEMGLGAFGARIEAVENRRQFAQARATTVVPQDIQDNRPPLTAPDVIVGGLPVYTRQEDAEALVEFRNARRLPGDEPVRALPLLGGAAWVVQRDRRLIDQQARRAEEAEAETARKAQRIEAFKRRQEGKPEPKSEPKPIAPSLPPQPDARIGNLPAFNDRKKAEALAAFRNDRAMPDDQPVQVRPILGGSVFIVGTEAGISRAMAAPETTVQQEAATSPTPASSEETVDVPQEAEASEPGLDDPSRPDTRESSVASSPQDETPATPPEGSPAVDQQTPEGARERDEQGEVSPSTEGSNDSETPKGSREPGGVAEASDVFERRHRLQTPIKGKTGAEIVAYRWMSQMEEGMFRDRRVSDWSRSQISEPTGREIVHLYLVRTPDGTETLMGVGAAKKALGIAESRLYAIAKREAQNQRIRSEQNARDAARIEAGAATSVEGANAAFRKVNDPARMMWGTPEQHRASAEESFARASLLSKGDKFIRTGLTDVIENLTEHGWTPVAQPSGERRTNVAQRTEAVGTPQQANKGEPDWNAKRPAKMTDAELKAELKAAKVPILPNTTREQWIKAVKAKRKGEIERWKRGNKPKESRNEGTKAGKRSGAGQQQGPASDGNAPRPGRTGDGEVGAKPAAVPPDPRERKRRKGEWTIASIVEQARKALGSIVERDVFIVNGEPASSAFQGPLPAEMEWALQGRSHLRKYFPANTGRSTDTGLDTMGQMGAEWMVEQADLQNRSTKRGDASDNAVLDELRLYAKGGDPWAVVSAWIIDNRPSGDDRSVLAVVDTPWETMRPGDRFNLMGTEFMVVEDRGTLVAVEQVDRTPYWDAFVEGMFSDTRPGVMIYLGGLDSLPIDAGTLIKGEGGDPGATFSQIPDPEPPVAPTTDPDTEADPDASYFDDGEGEVPDFMADVQADAPEPFARNLLGEIAIDAATKRQAPASRGGLFTPPARGGVILDLTLDKPESSIPEPERTADVEGQTTFEKLEAEPARDPSVPLKSWEKPEAEFIRSRLMNLARRHARGVEEAKTDLEKLRPSAHRQRAQLEMNIKAWSERETTYRQAMDGVENTRTASVIKELRDEYIKTVKKAISTGEKVPAAIIAQRPEFKKAVDARARYDKGRHTSFANESAAIDRTNRDARGYKTKRQDGKQITEAQKAEIESIVDDVEQAVGPLADILRSTGLTIAHTSGKYPFMKSSASGLYHPSDRSITIGLTLIGIKMRAATHELGHWLDYVAGEAKSLTTRVPNKSGKYAESSALSEVAKRASYTDTDAMLAEERGLINDATRKINETYKVMKKLRADSGKAETQEQKQEIEEVKFRLTPYWREPREVWARLFEQYVANKIGRQGEGNNSPKHYAATPGWWTQADFDAMAPTIEKIIQQKIEAVRSASHTEFAKLTDAQIRTELEAAGVEPDANATRDVLEADLAEVRRASTEAATEGKTLTDKIADLADAKIKAIEERQKKRGTRLKSGIDPAELADIVQWGGWQIVKGASKFTQWSQTMVAQFGDAIKPRLRSIWKDSKAFARKAIEELDNPDSAIRAAQAVAEKDAKGPKGRMPTRTTQQRDIAAGYREGVQYVRDQIPALRRQVRQAAKEGVENRAAVIQGIREEIRRLVESNLPPWVQGRFLSDLTTVTTIGGLARTINKIRRELARTTGLSMSRDIKRALSGWRKLDNETREALAPLRAQAVLERDMLKRTRPGRGRVTTERIELAASRLTDLRAEIGALVMAYHDARKRHAALNMATVLEARETLVAAVEAKTESRAADDETDVRRTGMQWIGQKLSDPRNIAQAIEGKDGVLERLMHTELVTAEDAKHAMQRDLEAQLETAVQRAGYDDLADFINRTMFWRGRGTVDRITVALGGKERSLTMGEAIHLVAMAQDPTTEALIEKGLPIIFGRGMFRKPIKGVTLEQIDAIREAIGEDRFALVEEVGEMIQSIRPDLFAAHKEVTGFEPIATRNYFPRKRATKATEDAGVPQNWQQVERKYLENLGFMKERTGGTKSPLVVGDFGSVVLEYFDNATKLIHLAKPIRTLSSVTLAQSVRDAISTRHGARSVRLLEQFIGAASMANEQLTTAQGKMMSWFNTNMAVAMLAMNPGTWGKQLGGVPRLMAYFEPADVTAAMARMGEISTQELTELSGYFWARYIAAPAARFSGVHYSGMGGRTRKGVQSGIDRALKNVQAGDFLGAFNSLREAGMAPLQILNWFDAINAKIAYMAATIEQERAGEVDPVAAARRAADAVRETQNASSVLDAPMVVLETRDNILSALFLFQSDLMKQRNRILRAKREGPEQFTKAVASEMGNIIWARLVGTGWALGSGALLVALAGGDEDDQAAMREKALNWDTMLMGTVRDVAGLVDPVFTPRLMDMATYSQSSTTDVPLTDIVKSVEQSVRSAKDAITERDAERVLEAIEDVTREVTGLFGVNPLYSLWRRADKVLGDME